jgi:hypothetical protein
MTNIEILKNWCLEKTYLNFHEFKYKHGIIREEKIILCFYSEKIEETTSFSFFLDEKEYTKTRIYNVNSYLLSKVLSKIRIDNINKILNQ